VADFFEVFLVEDVYSLKSSLQTPIMNFFGRFQTIIVIYVKKMKNCKKSLIFQKNKIGHFFNVLEI